LRQKILWIFLIGLLVTPIYTSHAQIQQPVEQPSQQIQDTNTSTIPQFPEIKDKDVQVLQTFSNGTSLVKHSFFIPEVLDFVDQNNKPHYTKFKYNEDANHISFESAVITFTYDKSTCGIKVFEKGRLKQNSQPVLDWVGVSLKEAAINSTDWVDSTVNFVQCQTTPVQVTENGIVFSAIKKNQDGIFETRYVADYGSGLEDFYIYNNTAGVNKQFGYTTTINNKLNLKVGGAVINRQYVTDTITLNMTEPVKLENGLIVDKMNEPMFLLQRHKSTQDVYDFTKGKHLKKNEVLVVDPKIRYTSGTTDFVIPSGVTSITVKAWGGAGGDSGGVSGYGGGFATGTLSVSAGQTYKIVVGVGGGTGGSGTFSNGLYGGGYSGIFLTSVTQGNAKIVAGGGGGVGGQSVGVGSCNISGGGGGDGTLVAGGTGGSGGSGVGCTSGSSGSAGGVLVAGGGGSSSSSGGGGGGAGYYGGGGGGGGAYSGGSGYGAGGRGGRGSNFATGTSTYTEFGTIGAAAAKTDPDYISGVAEGGRGGMVVILITMTLNPPTNFLASHNEWYVRYTWTPSTSLFVDGYYISKSLDGVNYFDEVFVSGKDTNLYDDKVVYNRDTLYYIRIKATSTSDNTNSTYTTTTFTVLSPNKPTLVAPLTRVNSNTIQVQSIAGPPTTNPPTTFDLRCSKNNGSWVTIVNNQPIPSDRKYTITGFYTDGDLIRCEWSDRNSYGNSLWSNQAEFKTSSTSFNWLTVTNSLLLDVDNDGIIDSAYSYDITTNPRVLILNKIFGRGLIDSVQLEMIQNGTSPTISFIPLSGPKIGIGGSGSVVCGASPVPLTIKNGVYDITQNKFTTLNTVYKLGLTTPTATSTVTVLPPVLTNNTHFLSLINDLTDQCGSSAVAKLMLNSNLITSASGTSTQTYSGDTAHFTIFNRVYQSSNNFNSFVSQATGLTSNAGFVYKNTGGIVTQQAGTTFSSLIPEHVFAVSSTNNVLRLSNLDISTTSSPTWGAKINEMISKITPSDLVYFLYYKILKSDLTSDVVRVKIKTGGMEYIGLISGTTLYYAPVPDVSSYKKQVYLLDNNPYSIPDTAVSTALPAQSFTLRTPTGDTSISSKSGLFGIIDNYFIIPSTTIMRSFDPTVSDAFMKIMPIHIPPTTGLTQLVFYVKNAPTNSGIRIESQKTNSMSLLYHWSVGKLDAQKYFTVDLVSNDCVNVWIRDLDINPPLWSSLGTLCASGTMPKQVVYTQSLSFTFWTMPWGTASTYDQTTDTLVTQVRHQNNGYTYNVRIYDKNGTNVISAKYTDQNGLSVKTFNMSGVQKPARLEILDADNRTLYFANVGSPNYLTGIQTFANQYLTISGFNLLMLMPIVFAAMWTRNTVGVGTMMTVVMIMTMVWLGLFSLPEEVLYLMVFIAAVGMIAYKTFA
jgi:hypothetical protein